jgi:uncharacterized protein (DUF849 family)
MFLLPQKTLPQLQLMLLKLVLQSHTYTQETPETGLGSRDPKLFKEIVDRVRDSNTDIVINITAGMGGDWISDASNQLYLDLELI